jgi:hypothetical protein
MAYSADGTDLQTEDTEVIKSEGLEAISDPFLSEDETAAESRFETQGPYLCPRCKGLTLNLRFGGFWD